MNRNRIAGVAAAGMASLVLGLAGCSTDPGDDGGVELQYWTVSLQEEQIEALDTIIATFEEENPGVTVTVTQKDSDALRDSLRQAAGTRAMPDIYFTFSGLGIGGEYVNQGMSLDLTEYYEQNDWDSLFTPTSLASVRQYGGYNGVPYSINTESMVYNKELFEKAGISAVPTSYDELIDAAEKLKEAGITPITFGGSVNWHLMRLLDNILETTCGSQTFDRLTALEADWSEEACVAEAFTELATWVDDYVGEGWVSETAEQAQQKFFQGQVGMALEGDWFNNMLVDAGFPTDNAGVFAFPTGTGRLYSLQQANYVSSTTAHPDEAVAFLKLWESPETLNDPELAIFSSIPVITDAVTSTDGLIPSFVELAETSTGSFQNNDQAFPADVTTEYWRIQNAVATGSLSPDDAGAELQTFIENR